MDNIPMRPPKLPGYDFVQMLGSGATATVYLYNQRMPARPVAVKTSAKTLDPRAAVLFNREANFMAKLSSHPYILPDMVPASPPMAMATSSSNMRRAAPTTAS